MSKIFWFRRDRRLQDNVALNIAVLAARSESVPIYPVYAVSPEFDSLLPIRQHSILESLKSLSQSLGGHLSVGQGDVSETLVAAAKAVGANAVHATRAFDTEGMAEQAEVLQRLEASGIRLQLEDSYYAVSPGKIFKDDGNALRVYTPFYKRWMAHGWAAPQPLPEGHIDWRPIEGWRVLPKPSANAEFEIRAGEAFALETWSRFKGPRLEGYQENRNRTDLSGTSQLGHALAHGEIHPRTLLAELGTSAGQEVFRKELAWREFYADVMFHNPHTLDGYFEPRFEKMTYDTGPEAEHKFRLWTEGATGYPIVDAAMRQLSSTGWMHNRSRMIVASFLVKDLHLEWQRGASWFERNLTDYDPASNSHGWQWTAGCGTDASPYYRVFNPVLQGKKFDPSGDYVRKFVPELRHILGPEVHEPWLLIDGLAHGYPAPILDHSIEREDALLRLEMLKLEGKQRI